MQTLSSLYARNVDFRHLTPFTRLPVAELFEMGQGDGDGIGYRRAVDVLVGTIFVFLPILIN